MFMEEGIDGMYRGVYVRFLNENGYENERAKAAEVLGFNQAYQIESVSVGSFSSTIFLKDFPGQPFNSVMFEVVEDVQK